MDEYSKYAFVAICHEGAEKGSPKWFKGIGDDIRSKDNATLNGVKNDAEKFFEYFANNDNCISSQKLVNPSVGQTIDSIEEVIREINKLEQTVPEQYALTIFFSGHGHEQDGSMQLDGGQLPADQLYNIIKNSYLGSVLQVDFVMDSCHSGKFIANALRTQQEDKSQKLYLYDLWASCLPDEKAFELKILKHGVFTYCFHNKGNKHVDLTELAKAINNITIDKKTDSIDIKSVRNIFMHLQGVTVPNPVTLLALGKQHSFNIFRSHHVTVDGGASFELPNKITLAGFTNTLTRAIEKYNGEIKYSDDYQ